MRAAILRSGILLALAALGTSAATAQTELFFATGVDSTGRALAQSNADGHVLIESPQYPHGLWLHLVNEAGEALAGIRVEYQGRPDSLVAIRCVDPVGDVRETLVWTRPEGTLLRLTLKPKETADLPEGLDSIDWQIDPIAESLLEPVEETRLIGWEGVAAFLREHWQGQAGQIAVQIRSSTTFTTLAVEVEHPETIETLVEHLQQTYRPADTSLGESTALYVQVLRGGLASLQEGVILYLPLFADTYLERVVWESLDRPQGRLTSEAVIFLTELWAIYKAIHSLAGIEHLAALQRLYLDDNQIVDVTPLSQLNNLRRLWLGGNQIVDITPLNQLNKLRRLSLDGNQIVDVTPLSQLNNLQDLYLDGNQIVDVTPLNQLNKLRWLDLGGNQIVDITPLNQLINLNTLYLSENQIVDITPLNQLNKLRGLSLSRNPIDDITPLSQLNKLRSLWLGSNQIVDITPLSQLDNLEWLEMYGNRIVDITPLSQLNKLRWLYLNSNRIVDITPLSQLNKLQELTLVNNRIVDITPLSQLNNLERLGLGGNPLSDQARNEHIPALQARGVEVTY